MQTSILRLSWGLIRQAINGWSRPSSERRMRSVCRGQHPEDALNVADDHGPVLVQDRQGQEFDFLEVPALSPAAGSGQAEVGGDGEQLAPQLVGTDHGTARDHRQLFSRAPRPPPPVTWGGHSRGERPYLIDSDITLSIGKMRWRKGLRRLGPDVSAVTVVGVTPRCRRFRALRHASSAPGPRSPAAAGAAPAARPGGIRRGGSAASRSRAAARSQDVDPGREEVRHQHHAPRPSSTQQQARHGRCARPAEERLDDGLPAPPQGRGHVVQVVVGLRLAAAVGDQ